MSEPGKKGRQKGWYWPWVIGIGLLVGSGVPSFFLVYYSLNDPSFAVEDDYYQKALDWDQTMEQMRANKALGWSLDLDLERVAKTDGTRALDLRVLDREGAPLENCIVSLLYFHNARAGQRFEKTLAAQGDTYSSSLPMRRPGVWELRFKVERGESVFTETLTRELY